MRLAGGDELGLGFVLKADGAVHRQVWGVDLEHEAGLGNGQVFVAHLASKREYIIRMARIIRIEQSARDNAGRWRGHEAISLAAPGRFRVAPQARDLSVDRGRVAIAHLVDRLRRVELLAATRESFHQQLAKFGKVRDVARARPLRLAREAGHALRNIGLEADASLLAVVADVDADLVLPADHVGDAPLELRVEGTAFHCVAELGADQKLVERPAAGEAADVRDQKSLVAPSHALPSVS